MDGNPIAVITELGEVIPCRIQTNTKNNQGKYQDGKFIISSYSILIQLKPQFEASRIKINLSGKDLGEFEVQNVEYLTVVGRIKITV